MNVNVQCLALKRAHGYPLTHLKEHIKYIGQHNPDSFYNKDDDNVARTSFLISLNKQPTKGNDCGYKLIVTFSSEVSFMNECYVKQVIRSSIKEFESTVKSTIDWIAINHFHRSNEEAHSHIIIRGYSAGLKVTLQSYHWKVLEKLFKSNFDKARKSHDLKIGV
ncbi:hypothetical protein [Alkalicoccobacillus porphyridii]|uniref:Relaxase/mobilization nuclease domain-containing protein n=1 Tax=Alkalicoccobacillus porphyridii TaxID=2597270 RepID=A0A553ZWT5_9BACI|nr:hypothetical protein [Alkalicoccobacillus porphyridii]TSB45911.1 hypothetical protein FN960_13425 [Alkalicoccobacillus porphyridii]